MSLKAVLFDLDDTLYPECSYVRCGFETVARHLQQRFGFDRQSLLTEMLRLLQSEGRGRIFDCVLQARGRYHPDLVNELVMVYRTHRPRLCLDAEALGVLDSLRRLGLKLGVLTDGLVLMQEKKLQALGVPRLVDAVLCTDALGTAYWKPHPAGFLELSRQLDMLPRQALFVGNDPRKDIAGAKAVGMTTVHLSPAGARAEHADYTIRQLSELTSLVSWLVGGIPGAKGDMR